MTGTPNPQATERYGDEVQSIQLGELLGALSYALDMTQGQPKGHCMRCSWMGLQIAEKLGFSDVQKSEVYYTLLLKDVGCSSNAARICQLYMTDDLAFKHGAKVIDRSLSQVLRFVIRHSGSNTNLAQKFRTIFRVVKGGEQIINELIETRCHQGAEIAALLRFPQAVSDGIQGLDEHWDGGGNPYQLKGEDIPLYSRIALLTQVADVFHQEMGPEAAELEVQSRCGKWFDPAIVDAFLACAKADGFWETLRSDQLETIMYAHPAAQFAQEVDEEYLDQIAHAFARVVDAKSPFTSGHSERVALYTDMICEELEYHPPRRRWMKRAALLHDIGKLGISNTILDKPSKLTDAEFDIMKCHPTLGFEILSRVSIFDELAHVISAHHERLDGKGYPKSLSAPDLSRDMRVLAVADVFDALTAERPYREALPLSKVYAIMDDMVGSAIDPECYAAVQRAVSKADFLTFEI